ncbi:MAG: lytic transglycosylase domain-containing protein [Firmicutes bacterium]|nr:lytic transglycosylase domain-containing protein [Bacillota bacterium]
MIFIALINYKKIGEILYPIKYESEIKKYSKEYKVDYLLIASMIKAESNFNPNAKSNKGALGLMQIMPATGAWAAKEIGIKDYNEEMLFNPKVNIKIGCWYVNKLTKQFDNNIYLVLAAYNGGSGNVNKWLKNEKYSKNGTELEKIPFKETDKYLEKVTRNYSIYKKIYRN